MAILNILVKRKNWILQLKKYAYLIFLIPYFFAYISIYFGVQFHAPNIFAYSTLIFVFIILPILDHLIGHDPTNPTTDEIIILEQQYFYRWLTVLCAPLILALIIFGAYIYTSSILNVWGKIGWVLSIGVASGGIGIVVAHELIHKNTWYEKMAGGFLLSFVCYPTFKVEHLRGHHVCVGTDSDKSTAKYNQTVYSFLLQTLRYNFINGWKLEFLRLRQKGLSPFGLQNELIKWYSVSLLIAITFGITFGWRGLLFFFLQSLAAIILLEITNYIEHYGLQRKKLANGRYEPVAEKHSWNSDFLLSNLILFQLQRHSDHHMAAKRRYQSLSQKNDSPQLPGGYPAMVVLSLIPALWFRIIHPRIPS